MAITESKPKRQIIVAVSTRELKMAIFLALSSEPEIRVVATAANTAELLTYARSFQPEVIIFELELKGGPMADVLEKLSEVSPDSKIFIISKPSSYKLIGDLPVSENLICVEEANEAMIKLIETNT